MCVLFALAPLLVLDSKIARAGARPGHPKGSDVDPAPAFHFDEVQNHRKVLIV
jgi:hypothetical protein